MSRALLVIDLQNDYFDGGAFPLWNAAETLENVIGVVDRARDTGVPVVFVQHVADAEAGPSPFFNAGTSGAELHPPLRSRAPDAPVVVKHQADGFLDTELAEVLDGLGTTELLVCGMMTQNCVTHTAISPFAEGYSVTVLADCCTSVSEMIHLIALHAVTPRVTLAPSDGLLA